MSIFFFKSRRIRIVNFELFEISPFYLFSLVVFFLTNSTLSAQTCKTPNLGATTVGETQSCDPINFGYILNNYENNDTITMYEIDFGDGTSLSLSHNELNSAGVDTIYHSYAETSCTNADRAYTFKIVAGGNCATFPKAISIFPVVIGEPPHPDFTYQNPACAEDPVTFFNATIDGHNFNCRPDAHYSWDFGDGTVVQSDEKDDQEHTYTVPGEYTVQLTVEQDCGAQNIEKIINVVGPATSAFEIGGVSDPLMINTCAEDPVVYRPENVCVPVVVPVKSLSSGYGLKQTWKISPENGAVFSTGSTTSNRLEEQVTFEMSGTYRITLVAENVCGQDSSCVEVIVEDVPTTEDVRIEGIPDSYCAPATMDVFTNVQDAISYKWTIAGVGNDDPDQMKDSDTWNPGLVVLDAGVYQFSLELANSCGNIRVTRTVTVVPPFSAEIEQKEASFCDGTSLVLRAVQVSDASYRWQMNGAIIPDVTADSIEIGQAGNYTVEITKDHCAITSSASKVSSVSLPIAVIAPPKQQFFCDDEPVEALLQAHADDNFTYQWIKNGMDIDGANDDRITVYEIGDYSVEVHDETCSNTSDTINIAIGPTTDTDFIFDTIQCQAVEVVFTNQTPEIPGETVSYKWQFGDSTDVILEQDASHIYGLPGSYAVTLTGIINSTGCKKSITKAIDIVGTPVAGFTTSYVPQNLCGPLSAYFVNNSAGEDLIYRWDFGNGETSEDLEPPGITYQQGVLADTSYIVTLQIQSLVGSCPASVFTDTIVVKASPKAQFIFAVDTICADYPLEINNYSVGAPDNYTWEFGDQSAPLTTEETGTITHGFPYEGREDTVFYVRLSAANTCGSDTLTRPLVVQSKTVEAFYNLDDNSGCAPFDVHFTSNQTGYNSTTWIWDDIPGNSTTGGIEQTYSYTMAGVYQPQLIVQNGCNVDTFSQAITVYPLPVVSFEGPEGTCVGQEAIFNNTSPKPTGSIWGFTGIDDTVYIGSVPPPLVYNTPGTKGVSLIITNPVTGCQNQISKAIEVYELPVAGFEVPDNFCAGDTLAVQNNSTYASLFYWSFGQTGGVISGKSPEYVFNDPGVYDIRLEAQNEIGCADSLTRTINIQRQPQPVFEVSLTDTTITSPVGAVATNQTTFPSESEGAFNWDFGNGETYLGFDVPYTINYVNNTDEVQYITISLEAVTDVGCAASFTRTIMVGPSACDERIAIPNIFTPNGDGLNDVLRPLILNEQNNYRPVMNEDGLKNYRMQVYNRWGELVFQSTDAEKGWEGLGFAEGVYYCNVQYQCKSFSKGKLNSIEVTLKH